MWWSVLFFFVCVWTKCLRAHSNLHFDIFSVLFNLSPFKRPHTHCFMSYLIWDSHSLTYTHVKKPCNTTHNLSLATLLTLSEQRLMCVSRSVECTLSLSHTESRHLLSHATICLFVSRHSQVSRMIFFVCFTLNTHTHTCRLSLL